jgi:hypothetical protein
VVPNDQWKKSKNGWQEAAVTLVSWPCLTSFGPTRNALAWAAFLPVLDTVWEKNFEEKEAPQSI